MCCGKRKRNSDVVDPKAKAKPSKVVPAPDPVEPDPVKKVDLEAGLVDLKPPEPPPKLLPKGDEESVKEPVPVPEEPIKELPTEEVAPPHCELPVAVIEQVAPPRLRPGYTVTIHETYVVELERKSVASRWGFVWDVDSLRNNFSRVVNHVAARSLAAEWNENHPEKGIARGDMLITVNGKSGRLELLTMELGRNSICCEFKPAVHVN